MTDKCCRWCKYYKNKVCLCDEIEESLETQEIENITEDENGKKHYKYEYPESKFIPKNPHSFYCSNFL